MGGRVEEIRIELNTLSFWDNRLFDRVGWICEFVDSHPTWHAKKKKKKNPIQPNPPTPKN